MAKRQQQQNGRRQQQQLPPVIFMTICLVLGTLLVKLDSVSASSISLNGNLLQHQQQQQQHMEDNGEEHNYNVDKISQQRASTTVPSSTEVVDDEDDQSLKSNSATADLMRSQLLFGHPYQPLTMVKRAPGGFLGMRGKKDFEDDDDDAAINDIVNRITFPWEDIQNPDEDIIWDEYAKPNGRRYKKTPTAFYGVRGKKFAAINSANPNNDNRRWQDLLQKLEEDRMRDVILHDFINRLSDPSDLQAEMEKRAPTGFTGMRGKRPAIDEDTGLEKRGLGNNAFIGVRGKKDVSHQTFKRSPAGESSSVGSGGGGKQQRFADYGNKFVAVRGKKGSYDSKDNNNMATLYNSNGSPSAANVRLLYANSAKRTPSGFQGMRGKRPFTSSDEV